MDALFSLFIILLFCGVVYAVWSRFIRSPTDYNQGYSDFDLLSVNEKIEDVSRVGSEIEAMEQLLNSLDAIGAVRQFYVVSLEWVGNDGKNHSHSLYCNGSNSATESVRSILEKEVCEARAELSVKTAILYRETSGYSPTENTLSSKSFRDNNTLNKSV